MERGQEGYKKTVAIMDSFNADMARKYQHERDHYKQKFEDEEAKRILWKLSFVISLGFNAAWWLL